MRKLALKRKNCFIIFKCTCLKIHEKSNRKVQKSISVTETYMNNLFVMKTKKSNNCDIFR